MKWGKDPKARNTNSEFRFNAWRDKAFCNTINKKERGKILERQKTLLNDTKKIFKKSTGLSVLTILVS